MVLLTTGFILCQLLWYDLLPFARRWKSEDVTPPPQTVPASLALFAPPMPMCAVQTPPEPPSSLARANAPPFGPTPPIQSVLQETREIQDIQTSAEVEGTGGNAATTEDGMVIPGRKLEIGVEDVRNMV